MYNKKDLINLTDKSWQNYKNIFEQANRKRKHSLKDILHALLYVDKTGCQWRIDLIFLTKLQLFSQSGVPFRLQK